MTSKTILFHPPIIDFEGRTPAGWNENASQILIQGFELKGQVRRQKGPQDLTLQPMLPFDLGPCNFQELKSLPQDGLALTELPKNEETLELRAQSGPQTQFLATHADIAIYGGAAGGGKTYALLLEFLRHCDDQAFGAAIFRRTSEQIRMEGGLWGESQKIYPFFGGKGREMQLDWTFPSGARISFESLQYEKDKFQFQGAQFCGIGLDELTHFTESQFFYLLSRNRSSSGIRPYVRATTNPDAQSWVKNFLAPWLKRNHPCAAASGEIRYFTREDGEIKWFVEPREHSKSVTFIRASVFDNQILLAKDPGYVANLKSLNHIDRARLLDGNWDIVETGNLFKAEWFRYLHIAPQNQKKVRFWDLAATEAVAGTDPDYTVGVLMSRSNDGTITIHDVQRVRERPHGVERLVRSIAERDGEAVPIRMEQEPGSSGAAMIDRFRRSVLTGWDFNGVKSTGPKLERAKPLSAHAESGLVQLVRADWNQDFVNECARFPTPGVHDDQVDAASGAFRELVRRQTIELNFS